MTLMAGTGAVVYLGTSYLAMLWLKPKGSPVPCSHQSSGEKWEELSADYDSRIDWDEKVREFAVLESVLANVTLKSPLRCLGYGNISHSEAVNGASAGDSAGGVRRDGPEPVSAHHQREGHECGRNGSLASHVASR